MPPPGPFSFPLRCPIVAASGAVPPSVRLPADAAHHLGAVVTPGIAYRSRPGTPATIRETTGGALYRPGTVRAGVDRIVRRHGRSWVESITPVVVNLVADEPDEFRASAAELEGVRGPAAVELDLATRSPEGAAPFGHDPAQVRQIVAAVRRACLLPVIAKLPFDAPDVAGALRACAAAGASAVTLAGGVPVGDAFLVGPAVFPLVLDVVARVAPASPLPLMACGGVTSAAQARAYLRAGAVAVQVGSAHLANPRAACDVAAGLAPHQ